MSATLVWDRNVLLNSPFPEYQRGDEFTNLGFENLDLHLVNVTHGIEQLISSSTSTAWNLEHIFASVPENGTYQLRVDLTGFEFVDVPYTLAWWAGPDNRTPPGDFNSDGDVNAADYVVWRKMDGSEDTYAEWQTNFGMSYGSGSGSSAKVPEPSSLLVVVGICLGLSFLSRAKCNRIEQVTA